VRNAVVTGLRLVRFVSKSLVILIKLGDSTGTKVQARGPGSTFYEFKGRSFSRNSLSAGQSLWEQCDELAKSGVMVCTLWN